MGAVLPKGIVLHASSVADQRGAFVFLAPSGGGKSSIMIRLSSDSFGAIADDSVVIATGSDGVVRCLPCGSMKQNTGTENIGSAPLKGFFFVEKGVSANCSRVTGKYAFYRAMRSSSIMAYEHLSALERQQARLFLSRLFRMFPSKIIRYDLAENGIQVLNRLVNE